MSILMLLYAACLLYSNGFTILCFEFEFKSIPFPLLAQSMMLPLGWFDRISLTLSLNI